MSVAYHKVSALSVCSSTSVASTQCSYGFRIRFLTSPVLLSSDGNKRRK